MWRAVWRKRKKVFVVLMDLEKTYDRVDRERLWKVIRMYGVDGKLLRAVKSMYEDAKATV